MPDGKRLPLPATALRRRCDPGTLGFQTTAELEPLHELVGQERALSAIAFGARIKQDGFNVFAMGPAHAGRHNAIKRFLESKASTEAIPDDWVFVNNFDSPDRPVAICLPSGMGNRLKAAMTELIDDLSSSIPSMFESEDYRNRRKAIDDELETAQETAFEALHKKAQAQNIAILRTPMGFALAPLVNGQVIKPDVFKALPAKEREKIESVIETLQQELELTLRNVPALEKERRKKIRELNGELAELAVGMSIKDLVAQFGGHEQIRKYLENVRADLIASAELFLKPTEEDEQSSFGGASRLLAKHPLLARYGVNVIVSHADGGGTGAPVIFEEHPSLPRLFGRVDHRSIMGTLVTDFTLIKRGALHRANGGYLILDALRVLQEPWVWDALKRCLRRRKIETTSLADELGIAAAESLVPDAIPLSVKVVLVGSRELYYLLASFDPELPELFKVQADFDDETERTPEALLSFARFLAAVVKEEGLLPISAPAVARLVEEASRDADDSERLSLRVGIITDMLREAHFWCTEKKGAEIGVEHVERAIAERRRRSERMRERSLEAISRNILLVDTEGEKVGQVNGLSVFSLGELSFGKPSRITARVRMGAGKVVDIEREVELGGPIHSKGVLILSGYLASHFALDCPVSLWASLVFEQSYGGVEGDSASSAELYALLSALAELPVRQSLAVTGSVNQFGEVQAIGGVNEKIEGFFDLCCARGLDGTHGVLIPRANIVHLMLRPDIVEAAEAGRFSVYAVSSVDEGIALLTGCEAGSRGLDGAFPPDSVNGRVEARLSDFAAVRQAFGRAIDEETRR
jgi:predicted ATP-dependent protease